MKHFALCILLMVLTQQSTIASCDFSTLVKSNGFYQYSVDCHIKVGKTIQENELRVEQVEKLNKVITLKDLAISKSSERIDLWKSTSYKLEDRLLKHDAMSRKNDWVLFGGGVLTTILAGWALGQATK